MNRLNARLAGRPVLLASLLVIFGSGAGFAQTPPSPGAAALCVYQDQGYSEGATVCPQTRFMLICSADGAKLVWKPVADRALADRCVRPSVADASPRASRRQRIARSSPPPAPTAAGTSAKCFVFNNRRYCE